MRQAKATRTLEDGTIEVFYIDLDKKEVVLEEKEVSTKKKSSRSRSNEDNKKQKEKQTAPTSKADVSITRAKS